MKKRFLLLLALSCIFIFNVSAAPKKIKIKKNQVAVITKVHVETFSNLEFFEKSFECTEEDKLRNNNYFLPCIFPRGRMFAASEVTEFEMTAEAEDGKYCVAIYNLPPNRTLYFISPVQYMYHKIYTMNIYLPTYFKVKIPADVKCIYIGDLDYTVEGDNFEVSDFKIKDHFEDAKEFLKTVKGLETEDLCHGDLNEIEDSDKDDIPKDVSIDMSVTGKRFIMRNRVYTYQ